MLGLNIKPVEFKHNFCFTFESSAGCSNIDHFIVSESVLRNCSKIDIIDSGINMSDHKPIVIVVDLNVLQEPTVMSGNKIFNRYVLDQHYESTGLAVQKIRVPFHLMSKNYDVEYVREGLDVFSDDIVNVLSSVADKYILKYPRNFYKYWWCEELNILKITP